MIPQDARLALLERDPPFFRVQELQQELQNVLNSATYPIGLLLAGKIGKLSSEQKKALETAQSSLKKAVQLSTNSGSHRDNG